MAQAETDDSTINSEHRQILNLLDAMAHSRTSLSATAVDRLLGRVKKQIVVHLVHEEIILQQKSEIPSERLQRMKLASGQLQEAVVDRIDAIRRGDSNDVSAGVRTLRQWIEKHVEEVGKEVRTNTDVDHLEIQFLSFDGCPNAAQTRYQARSSSRVGPSRSTESGPEFSRRV